MSQSWNTTLTWQLFFRYWLAQNNAFQFFYCFKYRSQRTLISGYVAIVKHHITMLCQPSNNFSLPYLLDAPLPACPLCIICIDCSPPPLVVGGPIRATADRFAASAIVTVRWPVGIANSRKVSISYLRNSTNFHCVVHPQSTKYQNCTRGKINFVFWDIGRELSVKQQLSWLNEIPKHKWSKLISFKSWKSIKSSVGIRFLPL